MTAKVANNINKDVRRVKLNLIAAADEYMGIGKDDVLPWHLPSEFNYFLNMTTNPRPDTQGNKRRNTIIIGRKTWETLDQLTSKPFPKSLNIVLSTKEGLRVETSKYKDTILCKSMKEAIKVIQDNINITDEVWVLGGAAVYKEAIESEYFNRLYLTKIHHTYDCDSYFPDDVNIEDRTKFKLLKYDEINDERVLKGIQTDEKTKVKFQIMVYEKV